MKTIYLLICFVLLIPLTYAFDIDIEQNIAVHPSTLYASHEIQKLDLELDLGIEFYILDNFTELNPRGELSIYFNPFELSNSWPIELLNLSICEGRITGSGYNAVSTSCDKEMEFNKLTYPQGREYVIHNGNLLNANYSSYRFTFNPKNNKQYVLHLIGRYKDYVSNQGGLYAAPIKFQNIRGFNNILNNFVFPDKDSIPRFIPDNLEIQKLYYKDINNKLFFKWVFVFNDTQDRIIFYTDNKEIEKREEDLVWIGAKWGFYLSLPLSITLLLLELLFGSTWRYWLRRLWDRLRCKNVVVGSKNSDKYHLMNCVFFDNISDDNRIEFKDNAEAEKNGYVSCDICKSSNTK